jgi:hypothetical protein
VLKEFARLDYRGLAWHLADHPDLGALIGLKAVPHYTTFQKAAQRLLAAVPGRKIFDAVLERALRDGTRKRRVHLAAVDGTGLESRHVSRYFTKRQADGNPEGDRTYAHYPKVVFVVDCASHMILSTVPGRGPATDLVQFGRAFTQAVRRARIEVLLADADFDAEWLHMSVRSHGTRTIIPPKRGRPSDKPPTGRWRRVMKQRFARLKRKYGQRWQVETVNSMIKRRLGSALRARIEANQFREITLRAITHNVMIVRLQVFYRAADHRFQSGGFVAEPLGDSLEWFRVHEDGAKGLVMTLEGQFGLKEELAGVTAVHDAGSRMLIIFWPETRAERTAKIGGETVSNRPSPRVGP